jgi:acyl-CoA oxidase
VGHGSNIRALQTTATYVPGEDCFVLNTPTVESFKWWPGTLGRTANTAMVIARLVLPGKDGRPQDLGIHNFIVPLRDLDTHELLPGVVTRDIGPKIGGSSGDEVAALFDPDIGDVISCRKQALMAWTMAAWSCTTSRSLGHTWPAASTGSRTGST